MSDDYDFETMTNEQLYALLPTAEGFEKFRILYQLAHNKLHEREYLQAVALAQQTLDHTRAYDFIREQAHTLHLLGYLYHQLNQSKDSIKCYTEASAIMHSIGVDSEAANIEGSIGEAYWKTQDYRNAAIHYETAFNLYKSIDDHLHASLAAHDYADAMIELGHLNFAITWFNNALDFAKKSQDSHRIYRAYRGLARAYMFIGDFELALDAGTKMLAVAKTCSCLHCVPNSHILLGRIQNLAGNSRIAKSHIEFANDLYKEQNNMRGQAFCEFELGKSAVLEYEFRTASTHLRNAMMFSEMLDEPMYTFEVHATQGRLNQLRDNLEDAIESFNAAYEIAHREPFLCSLKHQMLPWYLEVLELTGRGKRMLKVLKHIKNETDPWLLSAYQRTAYAGRAHILLGDTESARREAESGLILNSPDIPHDCSGSFHQTRAEAMRESHPREALNEAHKAISYYVCGGDFERAAKIAQEWVIDPDRRNRKQMQLEENRNTYEEICGHSDPITQQLQDEQRLYEAAFESPDEEHLA